MIIEMVLSQVREDSGIKFDPPNSLLNQGMTRNFHGCRLESSIAHHGNHPLEFNRLGGRAGGRRDNSRQDIFNRSDQTAGPANPLAKMTDNTCRGCFSIGSGHPCHSKGGGGMAVKCIGNVRHRFPCRGHPDKRNSKPTQFLVTDDANCSAPSSVSGEAPSVFL